MFRYLSLAWDPKSTEQIAIAERLLGRIRALNWQSAIHCSASGLAVFCMDARPGINSIYRLDGGCAVIVGQLFRQGVIGSDASVSQPVARVEASETARLLKDGGRFLADSVWGRYIAFWHSESDSTSYVFRDPSGVLPCFVARHGGLRICFSWLSDFLQVTGVQPKVNWNYIAALVPRALIQNSDTGLEGITQVLQGEQIALQGRESTRMCWDPHAIAASDPIENHSAAAQMLRHATRSSVHAWASRYEGVVLRLSGGIDSSIVLSCLRDAPSKPRVTCLTHYSNGAHFDERPFARIAARSAAFELVECEQPEQVTLRAILGMAASPFPRSCVPAIQSDRTEAEIARSLGAGAIFSGGGGDQIYYQCNLALPPADYVRMHGVRPRLLPLCLSAARATQTSLWSVLQNSVREGLSSKGWSSASEIDEYRHLVPRGVIESTRNDPSITHPWLRDANRSSVGKTYHIYSFASPPDYYDLRGQAADAEFVHPLWSQPLLELALRIPTYVLTYHGWDRALARRAFATDLPHEIVSRRTKGVLDHYVTEIFRRNLNFARELLLDGLLVKEGLLDRRALEEVLSGRPTTIGSPIVELFDHLSTEAWLRSWSSYAAVAAA
jgi:asparagine synthase (glutamine-hydrolysing)